jgi:hypothetical protein
MPAGDRSGPMGMGPGTGRGMGICGGYDAPGWANPGLGRRFYGRSGWGFRGRGGRWAGHGFGRGGGGRGWRNPYHPPRLPHWGTLPAGVYGAAYDDAYAPPSREQEIDLLKGEAEWLSGQLDTINQRMEELAQE